MLRADHFEKRRVCAPVREPLAAASHELREYLQLEAGESLQVDAMMMDTAARLAV
jgi:hypothetical protein